MVAGIALLVAPWLTLHERHADVPAAAADHKPAPAASKPFAATSEPTPRARLIAAQDQLRGTGRDLCSLAAESAASAASGAGAGAGADDPATIAATQRSPSFIAFQAGVHHIDNALRTSPDPYANAVAIWLNIPLDEQAEGAVPDAERRRQLAALANATTDPRIYALAFRTCRGSSEDGCHALSARRWAEIDAGNAMPWAFLLEEAATRGDVSGQEEAMFHMAAARRLADRELTQVQPVIGSSDGSAGDLMAAEGLSTMAIGIAAAWPWPKALFRHCNAAAVVEANRAQLCAKFADVMFDHSDSFFGRLSGASLTKRLTGDASRGATVNAELTLWNAAWARTKEVTCDTVKGQLILLTQVANGGPQAALQASPGASAAR